MAGSDGKGGAFARKSVAQLRSDEATHGLKRALGPVGLVFLGIGCTVGAGIYVLPGNVAANFAGPAILLSFIVAGFACSMTALCYAELASTLPAGGSAYTYCYASMGQGFAFLIGWLLVFEFGVAASTLAVGFAGYSTSLLRDFGVVIPPQLARSLVQSSRHGTELALTGNVNLVASAAALVTTMLLTRGVAELSRVNTLLVAIKLTIIAVFIVVGLGAFQPQNWTPFLPPNEGAFQYGWPGVFRGASILFFAYLGFEVVAYAASESRNPQRDLPIGILGSLVVCTLIYMLVATALTGVVPYRELGVPDPLALVVDRLGRPQLAVLVKLGALVGIASVLLINGYGQSRLAFTMARDGMLPGFFARLHPAFRTPSQGIVVLGVITALASATLPLSILNDLVSIGTAFAFSIVALSLMWLRSTQPALHRPFRVPLSGVRIGRVWIGVVPLAAIACSWLMILPAAIDMVRQARQGHVLPLLILLLYMAAGAVLYARATRNGLRAARATMDQAPAAPLPE
jgi:basic amino acid/polyamine antiporter, APA family